MFCKILIISVLCFFVSSNTNSYNKKKPPNLWKAFCMAFKAIIF